MRTVGNRGAYFVNQLLGDAVEAPVQSPPGVRRSCPKPHGDLKRMSSELVHRIYVETNLTMCVPQFA